MIAVISHCWHWCSQLAGNHRNYSTCESKQGYWSMDLTFSVARHCEANHLHFGFVSFLLIEMFISSLICLLGKHYCTYESNDYLHICHISVLHTCWLQQLYKVADAGSCWQEKDDWIAVPIWSVSAKWIPMPSTLSAASLSDSSLLCTWVRPFVIRVVWQSLEILCRF